MSPSAGCPVAACGGRPESPAPVKGGGCSRNLPGSVCSLEPPPETALWGSCGGGSVVRGEGPPSLSGRYSALLGGRSRGGAPGGSLSLGPGSSWERGCPHWMCLWHLRWGRWFLVVLLVCLGGRFWGLSLGLLRFAWRNLRGFSMLTACLVCPRRSGVPSRASPWRSDGRQLAPFVLLGARTRFCPRGGPTPSLQRACRCWSRRRLLWRARRIWCLPSSPPAPPRRRLRGPRRPEGRGLRKGLRRRPLARARCRRRGRPNAARMTRQWRRRKRGRRGQRRRS